MASAFKVKISDGSIVGPLDMTMLQSWYQQGLIDHDTPVLAPGKQRWGKLQDVLNVGIALRPRRSKKKDSMRSLADEVPASEGRAGRVLAGGTLIVFAAAAVVARLAPGAWRPDLTPTPWMELAYGWVLLGLLSLHGAEWSRKAARAGVGLAAFALFPVAGLLIAERVPLDALAVVACAWVAASGLFFLLSPFLPTARIVGATAVVLAGALGVARFGIIARSHDAHRLAGRPRSLRCACDHT
jgi:hypothetical protein